MALPYYIASRPIIAAHRGLSSIFPENTIEGFMEALKWSDFIELDVVLNKQGEVIVCHDSFLSLVSNIANLQQFQNRKQLKKLNGKDKEDWWICDFTLAELKEVSLRQCILKRSSELDYTVKIPTLRDVLQLLLEYNKKNATKKGILLEIKDYDYHIQYCQKNVSEPVIELLNDIGLGTQEECAAKLPIVIMSFDQPILKYCKNACNLPLAQLIEQHEGVIPQASEIAEYAQILGIDMKLLWQNDEPTQYYKNALENGLTVYGWTFQDDNQELKELFKFEEYGRIYQVSSQLLSGIITEFPQEAVKYIQ